MASFDWSYAKLVTIVAVVLHPVSARPAEAVESLCRWTSANGKYSIEASLLSIEDDTVHLKTRDGKAISVPFQSFAPAIV